MIPALARGANVRIEWSRETENDEGITIDQEFLIDGYIRAGNWRVKDYQGEPQEETQEILEIYLKAPEGWVSFDTNGFSPEEFDAILYSLSREYWLDQEMADEEFEEKNEDNSEEDILDFE